MSYNVVIVGAGIVGMTVGIQLLENNFEVTIITKDEPLKTNSDSAVATWYAPDDSQLLLQNLCLDSLSYFDDLSKISESGVQRIPIIYFFKNEEDFKNSRWSRETWQRLLNISEKLPENFLKNSKYPKAISANIPLIDINIYRPFLLNKFKKLGGKIQIRKVNSLLDASSKNDIVINCSGWEAKYLTNDNEVYPVRGQAEIAPSKNTIKQNYSFNIETLEAYGIFRPQSKDWVFGTTFQKNDAGNEIRETDKIEILNKVKPFFPEIDLLKTSSKVGIRCGRKNVRIENELIINKQNKQILLIHCYGHGGSGVSASWGSALKVFEQCINYVNKLNPSHSKRISFN